MSFDDILRQGQQIAAESDVKRQSDDVDRLAAQASLERWRDSVREFGRWFAAAATQQGLETAEFGREQTEAVPAPPVKTRGWRRTQPVAPSPLLLPQVERHYGWGILPLTPGGSDVYLGINAIKYGGHWNYDQYLGWKLAHPCLAISTSGKVRVGLKQERRVMIQWFEHKVIGQGPDTLTPSMLLRDVAGLQNDRPMYTYEPQYSQGVGEAYAKANEEAEEAILSYYVAQAQRMLGAK